jgi:hypothetical protein
MDFNVILKRFTSTPGSEKGFLTVIGGRFIDSGALL